MSDPLSVQERLRLYCTAQKRAIQVPALGEGTDGGVFRTNMKTAVKVFHRQRSYETERNCYRVLQEHNITDICGFTVPWMREFSDSLMVIEMSIVEPPASWTSERPICTKMHPMTTNKWPSGWKLKNGSGNPTGRRSERFSLGSNHLASFSRTRARGTLSPSGIRH